MHLALGFVKQGRMTTIQLSFHEWLSKQPEKTQQHYQTFLLQSQSAFNTLHTQLAQNEIAMLRSLENPHPHSEDGAIEEAARRLQHTATQLIVLGTGGSSLCAQALLSMLPDAAGRVIFLPNVDTTSFRKLLDNHALSNCHILVVSKSGTTMETLSQMLLFIEALKAENLPVADHVTGLSDPSPSPLRELAEVHSFPMLDHDPDIGGRFSIFTNVALLPFAFGGGNVPALRKAAVAALQAQLTRPEALIDNAAMHCLFMQLGISQHVMFHYADALSPYVTWWRQVWAESLGKSGHGTTPVLALGTVDQHSQLQLYLDGVRDKAFTFITVDAPMMEDAFLPQNLPASLAYLSGHSLHDVLNASALATRDTVRSNHLPVQHLSLPQWNISAAAEMILCTILETLLTADMLGINPLDQPAVEEGKLRAKAILQPKTQG